MPSGGQYLASMVLFLLVFIVVEGVEHIVVELVEVVEGGLVCIKPVITQFHVCSSVVYLVLFEVSA